MKFYIKTIKDWIKIAKPRKLWMFLALITVFGAHVCILIAPIFAAKATVAITSGLYKETIINLIIAFGVLAVQYTLLHLNYLVYASLIKDVYVKTNMEFLNKSMNAKTKNFKHMSKEKILNIIHTDVFQISDFGDKLATTFSRILMVIIVLSIIFSVSVWAGLIVVAADIIDYLILSWLNKKRAVYVKNIREDHDIQYESFSGILDSRHGLKDLGLEKKVKADFESVVNKYSKDLHKRTFWDSLIDNYFPTFYRFIIMVATVMLVIFVSHNSLGLEMYFIIVAYIAQGIENTNSIFSLFPNMRATSIAQERVKTVMEFVEFDKITSGKLDLKEILGNITFDNVSYKGDDEGNFALKPFSIVLKENNTHLIKGSAGSGKRTIFNMLRRGIKPSDGKIMFDAVDIFDYNDSSYLNNFTYVTTSPTFIKGSIIKNLSVFEKNKKIIYQLCKEVGIYETIESLPKKFNTDINSLTYNLKYLIALTRSILTTAEVMVIYELPSKLKFAEKEAMLVLLKKLHNTRTILIFSATNECDDLIDSTIFVEQGKVTTRKPKVITNS